MTTFAPRFRYLGITDECVKCQQCGKAELRSTIVLGILDADCNVEDVTHYGSTCAARALGISGGSREVLRAARAADRRTREEATAGRRVLARYGADDNGRLPDRTAEREAMRTFIRCNPRAAADGGVRAQVTGLLAHWAGKVADARRIGA